MKKFVRRGISLIILVVGTLGFNHLSWHGNGLANTPDKPIATIKQHSWDFGLVEAGRALEAKFCVQNLGGRRLVLNEKSVSCGCASTDTPTVTIPPGESGVVVARVKTQDLNGSFAFTVEYSTSDSASPTLTFTLFATIRSAESVDVPEPGIKREFVSVLVE